MAYTTKISKMTKFDFKKVVEKQKNNIMQII